jgi:hypothetical protein
MNFLLSTRRLSAWLVLGTSGYHINNGHAPLPAFHTVARSRQVCIEWMEATVLLSIYLRSELILIGTKVLPAGCPLADVPGSACETSPPRYHRHLATEIRPTHNTYMMGHVENCEDLPLPLAHVGDKKVKRFHFSEIIGRLPYMRATMTKMFI